MKFIAVNATDGSIIRINPACIACIWVDGDGDTCVELTTGHELHVLDSPMDIIESCEEVNDEH